MKRKKIIIAAMALALAVLAPAWSRAQSSGIYSGGGSGDNINGGSGSWGSMNNSGAGDNINGSSGTWGLFTNSGVDDNGSGSGSWGNFNNVDPTADLGSGLALLAMAGLGYAGAKRRKQKKA